MTDEKLINMIENIGSAIIEAGKPNFLIECIVPIIITAIGSILAYKLAEKSNKRKEGVELSWHACQDIWIPLEELIGNLIDACSMEEIDIKVIRNNWQKDRYLTNECEVESICKLFKFTSQKYRRNIVFIEENINTVEDIIKRYNMLADKCVNEIFNELERCILEEVLNFTKGKCNAVEYENDRKNKEVILDCLINDKTLPFFWLGNVKTIVIGDDIYSAITFYVDRYEESQKIANGTAIYDQFDEKEKHEIELYEEIIAAYPELLKVADFVYQDFICKNNEMRNIKGQLITELIKIRCMLNKKIDGVYKEMMK